MQLHFTTAAHPAAPRARELQAALGPECIRLYRGAYLDTRHAEGERFTAEDLHACRTFAVMQRNAGVVSGVSAANLHGLPLLRHRLEGDVVLTRKHRGTPGAGLRIRRSAIPDEDIQTRYGMRVTTPRRTLMDLAEQVNAFELLAATDAAMQQGLNPGLLPDSGRHCRTYAWVKEHASDRAESFAESWCRALIVEAGLPHPLLQVNVFDAAGRFVGRVDMAWPHLGLCFEFDGAVKYQQHLRPGESATDAVMREKQRERALLDLGWVVSRAVWADLRDARRFQSRLYTDIQRAARLPSVIGHWQLGAVQRSQPRDFSALLGVGVDAPYPALGIK